MSHQAEILADVYRLILSWNQSGCRKVSRPTGSQTLDIDRFEKTIDEYIIQHESNEKSDAAGVSSRGK